MEKKKLLLHPTPVSDSDESDSSEEEFESDEEQKQAFVRSDRITPSQALATSDSSQSDSSESESRGVAVQGKPVERAVSSGSESDSDSGSDSRSQLQGGGPRTISAMLASKRKDGGNGIAKKVLENSSSAQKPLKKDEQGAKKSKVEAPRRERDNTVEEKGPVKKRFKESSENASKGEQNVDKLHSTEGSHAEKAGREKYTPIQNGDRKTDREKTVQVPIRDLGKEPSKRASRQRIEEKSDSQLHATQPENVSVRKGSRSDNEGKHDKKVAKNSESDTVKEAVSPQKPRKNTFMWAPKDEITLSSEVLNSVKSGSEIPIKKVDDFWSKLSEQLRGKLEVEYTKEQLCDKVKRMKTRYNTIADKMKESQKPFKHRNNTDEILFGLWSQIWGKVDTSESEDTEEPDEVKDKEELSKPVVAAAKTVPVKESKLKQNKKDSDTAKGNQPKKSSSETEGSESEENDDGGALEGNRTTGVPMELEQKIMHETQAEVGGDRSHKSLSDLTVVPRDTGLHVQGSGKSSLSPSDFPKVLQDEIRSSLLEMQESSKQMLQEWLNKAMAVVENAVKTTADNSRLINGMSLTGIGGLSLPPHRNWEIMDFQLTHGEQAFQQQWYELHLQELEVYSQRLQLMQRECHLKQEQLKLQLERGK